MKIEQFEELDIWKQAISPAKDVYCLEGSAEFNRDYGFRDQLRRSGVSIASNIAEGFERNSNRDFIRFLRIAKGSCGEMRTQVRIAHDIGYISEETYKSIHRSAIHLSRRIQAFISYLNSQLGRYPGPRNKKS